MALRFDDISINTILGHGSAITGNIKINGFVRIDGDIDGDLETDGNIIIEEESRIRGNIKAKSIIVGGIVLGNIEAQESIKILSKAAVVGDIISHKIQVEQEAIIHGHCISVKDEEKFSAVSAEYLQSVAIKQKAVL